MPIRDRGPDEIVGICFHGIGTPSAGLEPAAHEYFVSADLFLAVLDETAGTPGVRLSFDDGYASDVEVALPALADRGLTATFFPLAGMLGRPGYLDEGGVRALSAAGMTVGSHGMHHRSWRGLDAESEDEELTVARSLIGAAAQAPVTTAACPFGSYDRRVLGTLRRHGYAHVFTSDRRRARGRLVAAALQHQARRHRWTASGSTSWLRGRPRSGSAAWPPRRSRPCGEAPGADRLCRRARGDRVSLVPRRPRVRGLRVHQVWPPSRPWRGASWSGWCRSPRLSRTPAGPPASSAR